MSDFVYNFHPGASPTILVCHGTGGDENSLTWLGEALFPGCALLCPRGQVSEYGAPRFFRRFSEGVFDLEDVRFRAGELAEFVAEAAVKHGFDPLTVFGVGYSNGANILAAMMLTRPESLMGAALFRAMVTLEDIGTPNLVGKKVVLSEGEVDPIVTEQNARKLSEQFRLAGANMKLIWQPGGHNLAKADVDTVSDWLSAEGLR